MLTTELYNQFISRITVNEDGVMDCSMVDQWILSEPIKMKLTHREKITLMTLARLCNEYRDRVNRNAFENSNSDGFNTEECAMKMINVLHEKILMSIVDY